MAPSSCRRAPAWASIWMPASFRSTGSRTTVEDMREDIVGRQIAAMSAAGLDALVSCSPESFAHLTGFVVPSQPLIRHRHAMVVVAASADRGILIVDMEETTVRGREPKTPTFVWAEFSDDCMAVLARMLAGMGLAHAKIGIETDYLPAGDM